jgi:hypothetical protein
MYGSFKGGISRIGASGAIAALALTAAVVAYYLATRGASTGTSVAANEQTPDAANAQASGVLSDLWTQLQNLGAEIGVGSPRGIRNNNPGNLEYSAGINWVGQVGADSGGYLIFDTAEHGARALGHDLVTAISEGYNTIEALITHYAPPSENDTAAYIAAVAAWGSLEAGSSIQVSDAPWIAAAVATQENGAGPWTAPNSLQYSAVDVQSWAGEA